MKKIYKPYTLKDEARLLYASLAEASRPITAPTADTKYSVTLGVSERDAKELFLLEESAAREAGFVSAGEAFNPADFQLCCTSGNKAAERVLASAALAARGKPEEEAAKIKERAAKRAELYRQFAGILNASSRVAFHDRFLDRYMQELSADERARSDTMGFNLSVLQSNGQLMALDKTHLFAEYKDKFYPGAYVAGAFTLTPWSRKKAEDKDGVSAYIARQGILFVKDGDRLGGGGPTLQDSFSHFTGHATDYSPSQAAGFSADAF